jgi:hypothetical protein
MTFVRLAGRIGVRALPASTTLPVSASTTIQAPGGGFEGAATAPVAGTNTTSTTAASRATTQERRCSMDCRVQTESP